MKKIYLGLFLLLGVFNVALSQPLISEGFESGSFPPTGWTSLNTSTNGGRPWYRTDAVFNNDLDDFYPALGGSLAMVYEYDAAGDANAWMITPARTLTAGQSYTLSFYYRVGDASFPEKMKVTVGTSATAEAQTTILWNNAGGAQLINTTYQLGLATFTPTTTGTYYFGFNCYSAKDQFILLVDDITLSTTPTTVPACATNLSPVTGTTNVFAYPLNLSWDAVSGALGYNVYLGTTNPPATTNPIFTTNTSVTLRGAAPNTTYYWYVVPSNSLGNATGCNTTPLSFTTQAVTAPANDDCANATPIDFVSVNATTIGATQSLPATECNGFTGTADDDVWFKFTASQNGAGTITLTPVGGFDAVMEAFSGACGSLVSLACADETVGGGNEVLTLPGLVAGQTYYLRVYNYSNAGFAGNFSLRTSGVALPIVLSDFRGENVSGVNVLQWATNSEANTKGFEIQRSADGISYSTIGYTNTKAENGSSTSRLFYRFDDKKPFDGNSYYRLKQLDKDGRATLSSVVLIRGNVTNKVRLSSVYPNPAKSVLNIVLSSPSNIKVNFIVTDLVGKTIMQQSSDMKTGDNFVPINIEKLAAGNYILKAICNTGCEVALSRFVKQ